MSSIPVYVLFGLGEGAVYAVLGMGTVLTHRASGVVNFAGAAMGMFSAFVFFRMRASGDLVLPLVGVRSEYHLTDRPTVATALLCALLVAALIGLAAYGLVFRPLRHAPPLARVVASLGLMLYLISAANLSFGGGKSSLSPIAPVLPDDDVTVLGRGIPVDRFLFAAAAAAVTAGLWAVFRYTRFGLATRAAAETEKGAVLTGHSPERLAALNWVLASVLMGAGLVVFANIGRLDPVETSLLIVPALAAALVGRFESVVVTALAGLAIGIMHTELLSLRSDWTWLPDVDIQDGVPFVVIIVAMVLRGRSIPERGAIVDTLFPPSPRPTVVRPAVVILGITAIVALYTLESNGRLAVMTTVIGVLLALSVVVLTGYVGQISLAPMAFAGVGAFAMVRFTNSAGLPFPVAPLLAAGLAVVVGLAVGLPAVRVRGMSLAIVTIAAALAIEKLLFGWSWFTGGRSGINVPAPEVGGIDLGIAATGTDFPRPVFGVLAVVVVTLAALGVANLRRSLTGLRWLAVRANEKAAAAAGIDVAGAKLSAFAVSSFLAGLGGTLLAYKTQSLSVDSFQVFNSLSLLALTYLGGIAGVAGAIVAGVMTSEGVLTALTTGTESSQYQFAIAGLALIIVAILAPGGLTGAALDGLRRLTGRRRSRRPPEPEPPAEVGADATATDREPVEAGAGR